MVKKEAHSSSTNNPSTKQRVKKALLVVLDSHAILHRAYHAIPDFSSSKGEPTGALYGLTSMLLKLTADLKPDYIVAARDLPGKTHRHEVYEAYKGTRQKTDDELIAQLERAPIVFKAFGIPLYEAPGFEADDVIGTIVEQLKTNKSVETVIATGDMDTLQLVNGAVAVYTMRKGLQDTVVYDDEAVKERYGFGPEHVVDYKALRGDPSDNIPGVKGIGEKGATELIKEFGSIEVMYDALEKKPDDFAKKVKPRTIELLKANKESAFFSKQLATIHPGAPITFSVPEVHWTLADNAGAIAAMCDELEFRALKERVKGIIAKAEQKEAPPAAPLPIVAHIRLRETSIALWLLRSSINDPSIEDILAYGNTDDFEKAREKIFADLKITGRLQEVYDTIEAPLIPIVEQMRKDGVLLDVPYFKKLTKEYSKGLAEIADRIYRHAGHEFNVSSPKQLGVVLYDELKITPERQKKTAGGARTTREDELSKLKDQHPIIADVLAYRELQKLLGTYIEKMPVLVDANDRLHAEFLQAGAATGRMASQNPGLQNIPIKTEHGRRIRNGFCADKGFLIASIDYSQIELRVAAGLSGDEKLMKVFKEGGDVHTTVASDVFGVAPDKVDREMRRRAKVINFGILYGMGVNALRANLGESVSREDAAKYLSEYFKQYEGVARYLEFIKADATKNGFTETLFGRRRYFPELKSSMPNLRAQGERMAINAPIQGTSADIIKIAMIKADELIEEKGWREKVRLLLSVHDELVFEVKKEEAIEITKALKEAMETAVPSSELKGVPIVAEASIGPNWGDLKRI